MPARAEFIFKKFVNYIIELHSFFVVLLHNRDLRVSDKKKKKKTRTRFTCALNDLYWRDLMKLYHYTEF